MAEIPLQDAAVEADSVEDAGGSALLWQSASQTDVGRVRPVNEDAFLDSQEQRLWVVADGMGGHSRGDYASGAIVRHLRDFPRQPSVLGNLQDLEARLQAANDQCRNAFRNKNPGSTVVVMLTHGNYCFYLWAGDSRIYRLRNGALEQLTTDHTLARQQLAHGQLSEEEVETDRSAHVLTRAVGIRETLDLDLGYAQILPGDRYLLCSDGFYNDMALSEIDSGLRQGSPEEACSDLVDRALAAGGRDNITLIVVDALGQG